MGELDTLHAHGLGWVRWGLGGAQLGIVQRFWQDGGEFIGNESDDAANADRRLLTQECIPTVRIGAVPTRPRYLRLQQSALAPEMILAVHDSMRTVGGGAVTYLPFRGTGR
jgi:hypothetical protein